jgi:hypothetical protein
MNWPYLSETPEFKATVRRKRIESVVCLPVRIVNAALDGYLSELRHTLDAPIYIGPGR